MHKWPSISTLHACTSSTCIHFRIIIQFRQSVWTQYYHVRKNLQSSSDHKWKNNYLFSMYVRVTGVHIPTIFKPAVPNLLMTAWDDLQISISNSLQSNLTPFLLSNKHVIYSVKGSSTPTKNKKTMLNHRKNNFKTPRSKLKIRARESLVKSFEAQKR